MEKSFPASKNSNPTALRYAAAQLLNSNRTYSGYPNSKWEATDVKLNKYGEYEPINNPYSQASTFQSSNHGSSGNAVVDTLDQFQRDYYNKTGNDIGRKVDDIKDYYSVSEGNRLKRGLASSQSQPIITTSYNGMDINPYMTPVFANVQYPVPQLDMDWYIRQ